MCAGCGYRPWPCASCGAPRCKCRVGDIYQHWYPKPVVAERPMALLKCGHPDREWNIAHIGGGVMGCRICRNDYQRTWRQKKREKQEGRWRAEPVSGEQLAEDYLRAQ